MQACILFKICLHHLVITLEEEAKRGFIKGLVVQNEQLLIKMFVDDSLLFLKADDRAMSNALEVIKRFAIASRSQRSIEKSKLISLLEG